MCHSLTHRIRLRLRLRLRRDINLWKLINHVIRVFLFFQLLVHYDIYRSYVLRHACRSINKVFSRAGIWLKLGRRVRHFFVITTLNSFVAIVR